MKIFVLVVAVVVVCGVAALVLGLVGGGMGRATTSLKHEPLPEDRLADADIAALQLDVGARGYRMSQVDAVLDRLRRELRERDEEIAVLRGGADAGQDHPGDRADDTGTDDQGPEETRPAGVDGGRAPTA